MSSNNLLKPTVGSGRFSVTLDDSESRAVLDPNNFMKDLKITTPAREQSLTKNIISIINQSLGNSLIKRCFNKPSVKKDDNSSQEFIQVGLNELKNSPRDGTKILYLILLGAVNAGFIDFTSQVKLTRGPGYINVLVTPEVSSSSGGSKGPAQPSQPSQPTSKPAAQPAKPAAQPAKPAAQKQKNKK